MTSTIALRNRTLHLVDIENLAGGGDVCADDVAAAFDAYLECAHWQPGDLVMVAANPHLAEQFAWSTPVDCRVRTATGTDGADLMLLAQAAPEFVTRRAGRFVVGSGDHAFITRALQVRATGVGVLVVARPGSIHNGWYAHGFPVVEIGSERLRHSA